MKKVKRENIMKIISISRIKNEEDIIESFIRYHLNFIDEMVIIEDYSNDETYEILKELQNEDLPIHIYRNSKEPIPQQEVINNAFNIALNDLGADMIVPLDGDEFLVCKEGGNPRDILEKLDAEKYYHVYWRTYLPDLKQESFSLDKLQMIRNPIFDDRSKIIVPAGLTQKYDVVLTPGSHSLEDKDIPFEELDELRIAHVPIRNKEQAISKEVIGWLNNISNFYKEPKASWHQNIMYQMLKDFDGKISDEQMIDYVKSYSSSKSLDNDVTEFEHPFDTEFCENIDLKYTPEYRSNCYTKIFEFVEIQSLNFGKTNQMLKDVNEDILANDTNQMNYLYNLEDAYTHVKKELYFKDNSLVLRNKKYRGNIEIKNDKISELKEKVSEKNTQIKELKKKSSEKSNKISELKTKNVKKQEKIDELKEKIKELKAENKRVKAENARVNKLNQDMLNSTSWKVTKPFRRS